MINPRLKIAAFMFIAFLLGAITGGVLLKLKTPLPIVPSTDEFVTGIGGVFFKVENPDNTRKWYRNNLGIVGEGSGVSFFWRERYNPNLYGFTVWSVFPRDTEYFGPNDQEYMINYRVRDLDSLLARLEAKGIQQIGEIEEYPYGRFAWIIDCDGKRVELWEPVYLSPEQFK